MVAKLDKVVRHLRDRIDEPTDTQQMQRFVETADHAAFETLVRRHGGMVYAVCRRVLKNATDAEDCLQATFLILVRKARTIRRPESLANWLYGVAYRVASKARVAGERRRVKEANVPPRMETDTDPDLLAVLDQELSCLPEQYRAAVVLCDLEGKTRKEAARVLNCAEGTVASRLSRGRLLLARRLARQGFVLTPAAVVVVLSSQVSALPVALVKTVGVASAKAILLAEGVLKMMQLSKLKVVTAVVLLVGVLTSPVFVGGSRTPAGEPPPRNAQKRSQVEDNVSDAEFIRRACLEVRGALPTDIEVHYFLGDKNPQKRAWLVEKLKEEAGRAKKRQARTDEERLQGTWEAVSVEHNSKREPDAAKGLKLVIEKGRVTTYRDGKQTGVYAYKLETKKDRRLMRLELLDADRPLRNDLFYIYELKGDRLKLGHVKRVADPDRNEFQETTGVQAELRRVEVGP